MKKKVAGKKAAGVKRTRAAKTASKSVNDKLFEKNLALLRKETEKGWKQVLGQTDLLVQWCKDKGYEVPPESRIVLAMGVVLTDQLDILTAELRTCRQIKEGKQR